MGVTGARKAASEVDQLRDKFDRLQKQGAKGFAIGAGVAATNLAINALGQGVSAVTGFIDDSIHAASNLNEQISKSGVVFGEASDEIQDFARGAADSLGLSERAALEAAGAFGQFFTGAGESAGAAEDMSEKMVALAADLASFNNLDPTEVLQKLRSGLAGEAEPLRAVGVFLTEAKVKAKAMQMGLANAHGELTEGAKVLARYQIILDETGKAQGDFARTSDSLANAERTKAAALENAQARVGAAFLPYATAIEKAETSFLNFVASGLEGWTMLEDEIDGTAEAAREMERETRAMAAAEDNAKRASGALSSEARDLAKSLRTVSDESRDVSGDIRTMRRDLHNAEIAARGLDGAMDDLTDALFGTAQRAGDLARAKQELADLKKAGPDSKSAGDLDIYNGLLAEARERIFEIENEIAKKGGKQAYLQWLVDQKLALQGVNSEFGTYLDRLIRAAQLEGAAAAGGGGGRRATSSGTAPTTTIPHGALPAFAEGGTVPGPEGSPQVILAHGGETVTPSGGGTTINLTVQGSIIAESKEAVVRELQRVAAFVRG